MVPKRILTSNIGDDTISIIDMDNPEINKKISLAEQRHKKLGPWDMVMKNDKVLYVLNSFDESLMTLDLESFKPCYLKKLGRNPICIKRYNSMLYIINCDSNSLSILDEYDLMVLEEIPLNEKPSDIQIDEFTSTAYIVCSNGCSISIMNLKDNSIEVINLEEQPFKLFLENSIVYVLSYINNGVINFSSISILNPKKKKLKQYKIEGNYMDLTVYDNVVLLTNPEDGYLYEFSITRKKLKKRIHLGGMPSRILRNNSILYVNDMINDDLIIVDLKENKIIKRINVGKEPQGLLLP
ncbi:hypothetical protein E9840_08070 [Tissierella creatinini]|nr:hypothetical protein E9840_08070 [Tissierella creatinini]TJX66680.1 hypothetical protein E8P77_07405 [Soehngenia saccharolytica]